VVKALRKIGATVADTSGVGEGFPDIVCGFRGVNWMIEVKDGKKPPSRRKLTPDQAEFFMAWRGQYAVVESAEQAIALVSV
jgi:Holliday junction resolvase